MIIVHFIVGAIFSKVSIMIPLPYFIETYGFFDFIFIFHPKLNFSTKGRIVDK